MQVKDIADYNRHILTYDKGYTSNRTHQVTIDIEVEVRDDGGKRSRNIMVNSHTIQLMNIAYLISI